MNAVIYARYSSANQTEQSIEGQLHDNYAWAKQHGITVIGEYIDRALTGTKDQRPDFQRMIEDASRKQFEMVIVWKLDRFARNRYDSAIYKARLKKHGVKVSHNPAAAMRVLGFAKVPRMLREGICVTIGMDGAPSNNRMDIVDEMWLTSLIHKGWRLEPDVVKAEEVLNMVPSKAPKP